MTKIKKLEGMTFNNLRVLKFSRFSEPVFCNGKNKGRRKFWLCKCEKCGKVSEQREDSLLNGHSKSCGCLQKEAVTKHGQWSRDNSLFWRYNMIVQRCYNKNNHAYKDYGGRGIKMCDEWRNNPKSFLDWAYASGYQKNLTIERLDVNGNYCPENCVWITIAEQQRNKRNNIKIIYKNQNYCVTDICNILNIPEGSVRYFANKNNITQQQAFDLIIRGTIKIRRRK